MTHTYNLIGARISMEAGKIKKTNKQNKKKEKRKRQRIRSLVVESFSCILSRLGESSKFVLFCLFFFVCLLAFFL